MRMNHIISFLLSVTVAQVALIETLTPVLPTKNAKVPQNKFISVNTACSKNALMTIAVLKDPFYGSLYARGYPQECFVMGNGSREISLTVNVTQCGTKIVRREDGNVQYDILMYIQYDRHVQQSTDQLVLVQCSPQEIIVTGRMGPSSMRAVRPGPPTSPTVPATTLSTIPATGAPSFVDTWMDLLLGRMPVAIPITEHVNVGNEITMLIKVRLEVGQASKVTNCFATDGSPNVQQELTDSNGCSVDPAIMPDLTETYNSRTSIKLFYTTFPAFKFPDKDNLQLQCRVLICNSTCPLERCPGLYFHSELRIVRSANQFSSVGSIVKEINVYDSVEVQPPTAETRSPQLTMEYKEPFSVASNFDEDLYCLNSTRMMIIIVVLLGALMTSLVITICMCVRARELKRHLMHRQSFPYGRVNDYP